MLECAALSRELVPPFEYLGRCVICRTDVTFTARYAWFRDHLQCPRCRSIPRERALMHVIETFHPTEPEAGRGRGRAVRRTCPSCGWLPRR